MLLRCGDNLGLGPTCLQVATCTLNSDDKNATDKHNLLVVTQEIITAFTCLWAFCCRHYTFLAWLPLTTLKAWASRLRHYSLGLLPVPLTYFANDDTVL